MLVSLTAFATAHGVKKQSASEWKRNGILVMVGDLIDADASDAKMKANGMGRYRTPGRGGPRKAEVAQPAPRPGKRAARRPKEVAAAVDKAVADLRDAAEEGEIDEEIASGFIDQLLAGQFRSKADAIAIKENALALKHLLAAQKEAGRLVEMEVAENVLFDVFRAARDAWMAWPSRFAPLLVADLNALLGLDIDLAKFTEALKPYIHQQLEELGTPEADFVAADS